MKAFENIGEFTCLNGNLLICDSFPVPALVNPQMSQNGSQCLHLKVKPGKYKVMYLYFDEDAMDYNPAHVQIIHESLEEMPFQLSMVHKLQVEGGRIAIIDREKASDEKTCMDFQYEAADTIHHNCGLVVTTLGDGVYEVLADELAVNIIIENQFEESFEEEVE